MQCQPKTIQLIWHNNRFLPNFKRIGSFLRPLSLQRQIGIRIPKIFRIQCNASLTFRQPHFGPRWIIILLCAPVNTQFWQCTPTSSNCCTKHPIQAKLIAMYFMKNKHFYFLKTHFFFIRNLIRSSILITKCQVL